MSVIFFNDTIAEIFKLVKETPNDKELGTKVRQYYWNYTKKQEELINKSKEDTNDTNK